MAERTYKRGQNVAIRGEYQRATTTGAARVLRHSVYSFGIEDEEFVKPEDIAPFLSEDEQDALLRVVRAAIGTRQFTGSAREPGLSFDELTERLKLHGARNHQLDEALSSLPETLRVRMTEGEG